MIHISVRAQWWLEPLMEAAYRMLSYRRVELWGFLFSHNRSVARYIERFRKAPPTPREGRRSGAGVGGNFWWQRPPRGPLGSESEPSLPWSHSTPDRSKSTPDTTTTSDSTDFQVRVFQSSHCIISTSFRLLLSIGYCLSFKDIVFLSLVEVFSFSGYLMTIYRSIA